MNMMHISRPRKKGGASTKQGMARNSPAISTPTRANSVRGKDEDNPHCDSPSSHSSLKRDVRHTKRVCSSEFDGKHG